MNILLAHNDYGKISGEEDALQAICSLLELNGHSVSWFRRSSAEISNNFGKAQAFLAGIWNPAARRRMVDVLKHNRIDLVHAQNLYPFHSPSILAGCQEHSIPVVMRCPNYRLFCPSGLHLSHGVLCERCLGGREYWCFLHNCENDYFKSLGYALRNAVARITRGILHNVNVFIVLSEFQKRRFVQGGIPDERIEILPNIAPEVDGLNTDEWGQLITFVGRASPEKGIDDFVAAAKRLPNLPFAVAGATERVAALMKGSPPNVQWLGFLNEARLNEIYVRSRCLVFPFRWFEGFPNVITRAMVLGRPVIAARIGAVPEIVDDGDTGLLFEVNNVDDLVNKIASLYHDPLRCRRMGSAARAKARAFYGRDVVYRRLIEIYHKAINLSHA